MLEIFEILYFLFYEIPLFVLYIILIVRMYKKINEFKTAFFKIVIFGGAIVSFL